MDSVYSKHNKEMRQFCDESSELIGKLDTCYSDAITLDSYLRKLGTRIEDARNMPLSARKYVEQHRSQCGDINEYLTRVDDMIEKELDGSV